jgi:hypothetical protein
MPYSDIPLDRLSEFLPKWCRNAAFNVCDGSHAGAWEPSKLAPVLR